MGEGMKEGYSLFSVWNTNLANKIRMRLYKKIGCIKRRKCVGSKKSHLAKKALKKNQICKVTAPSKSRSYDQIKIK